MLSSCFDVPNVSVEEEPRKAEDIVSALSMIPDAITQPEVTRRTIAIMKPSDRKLERLILEEKNERVLVTDWLDSRLNKLDKVPTDIYELKAAVHALESQIRDLHPLRGWDCAEELPKLSSAPREEVEMAEPVSGMLQRRGVLDFDAQPLVDRAWQELESWQHNCDLRVHELERLVNESNESRHRSDDPKGSSVKGASIALKEIKHAWDKLNSQVFSLEQAVERHVREQSVSHAPGVIATPAQVTQKSGAAKASVPGSDEWPALEEESHPQDRVRATNPNWANGEHSLRESVFRLEH
jgi:hypothetical protein